MTFDHITDPLVADKAAIRWEEAANDPAWEADEFGAAIKKEQLKNAAALRARARKLRGEE